MSGSRERGRRPRLPRPRLLPVTIIVMSALLAIKSLALVQAAAEENRLELPGPSSSPSPASTGMAPVASASGSLASDAPLGPPRGSPPISDAERAVLLDLRQRRLALDARARELDQREAEMAAADRRLGARVQQLSALQTRLESLEAGRRQHSAENWTGLVRVYEAMKPRDAAAIFDVLDMQVLLQVLDRMQERRAALVLAAMQPDRARLATQMLAEMRTRAVTPAAPSQTDQKS